MVIGDVLINLVRGISALLPIRDGLTILIQKANMTKPRQCYHACLFLTCASVRESPAAVRGLGGTHHPVIEEADPAVVADMSHPIEAARGVGGDLRRQG